MRLVSVAGGGTESAFSFVSYTDTCIPVECFFICIGPSLTNFPHLKTLESSSTTASVSSPMTKNVYCTDGAPCVESNTRVESVTNTSYSDFVTLCHLPFSSAGTSMAKHNKGNQSKIANGRRMDLTRFRRHDKHLQY